MKIVDSVDMTFEVGEIFQTDFVVDNVAGHVIPVDCMITCDEDGVCDGETGNGDHHKIIKKCRVKYTVWK